MPRLFCYPNALDVAISIKLNVSYFAKSLKTKKEWYNWPFRSRIFFLEFGPPTLQIRKKGSDLMTSTLREKQLLVSQLAWGARYNGIFVLKVSQYFHSFHGLKWTKCPRLDGDLACLLAKNTALQSIGNSHKSTEKHHLHLFLWRMKLNAGSQQRNPWHH